MGGVKKMNDYCEIEVYDYTSLLKEFIHSYDMRYKKSETLNKYNMNILMDINGYYEKYLYFYRLASLISRFLAICRRKEYKINVYLLEIISNEKQKMAILKTVKKICKKYQITRKDYLKLKNIIMLLENHLDIITNEILLDYMKVTPVISYKKIIEKEGKDFIEVVNTELQLIEAYDDTRKFKINPVVDNFAGIILDKLNEEQDNWRERMKKSMYKFCFTFHDINVQRGPKNKNNDEKGNEQP